MRLLCIGDVVGNPGMLTIRDHLRSLQKENKIDFTIVNGENAAGVGITPKQAEEIFSAGADVITLGNHVLNKRQIVPYLEDNRYLLRPANLAPQLPGEGHGIYDANGYRLLILNLIGRCDMAFGPDNPFLAADKILRSYEGQYDLAVCEMHANATSEKLAMGYYLDGRCAAVWGTHTHVQTADERINPKGTGYITDVGMTGPWWSVLGVKIEQSVAMFRGDLTEYFQSAEGECVLSGVVFDLDTTSGRCVAVERICRHLPTKGSIK